MNDLTEVRGLRAEANGVACSLTGEIHEPVIIQICVRSNQVAALHPLTIALIDLARVGGRKCVAVLTHLEPHVLAF